MSALGHLLSTDEGRAAFITYAEEAVRARIRKRWERRREETAEPPRARSMSTKGRPIPIVTALGLRSLRDAIDGDGVPTERPTENARKRRLQTKAIRTQVYLIR